MTEDERIVYENRQIEIAAEYAAITNELDALFAIRDTAIAVVKNWHRQDKLDDSMKILESLVCKYID